MQSLHICYTVVLYTGTFELFSYVNINCIIPIVELEQNLYWNPYYFQKLILQSVSVSHSTTYL